VLVVGERVHESVLDGSLDDAADDGVEHATRSSVDLRQPLAKNAASRSSRTMPENLEDTMENLSAAQTKCEMLLKIGGDRSRRDVASWHVAGVLV